MPSLAFDRAASCYDRTRALPPWVSRAITDSLVNQARLTAASRVLEIGIGTGRIAAPLWERRLTVVGVDLSAPMLCECQRKAIETGGRVALAQGDADALPLPDAAFDCVYAVNVLHVVAHWQHALREAWRVLKPGGCLLVSYGDVDPQSPFARICQRLHEMVRKHGVDARLPGAQSAEEVRAELEQAGETQTLLVARWSGAIAPGRVLDGLGARGVSDTWLIPDDVLEQTLPHVQAWAREVFGDLTRELPEDKAFRWMVVRKD